MAELSVGYAGFVAIFLIFARRDGRFEAHDAIRVQALFTASFMGVFMSLAPLVLSKSGLARPLEFRVAAGIIVVITLAIQVAIGVQQIRLAPEDKERLGFGNNIFAWGLGFVVVACLGSTALGISKGKEEFLYLLAVTSALGIATSNFVAIAIQKLK